jgi:hypothetical protein
MKSLYVTFFLCFIFCIFFSFINAQEQSSDIIDKYENYTSDAREVIYVHLNKSTYIKGESIGFTAYVLDKDKKKPSNLTTNLYITLEDEKGKLVSEKLLKVDNGVAENVIEMDSSFTFGHYTFKAYTNWMRNFNEKNYFIESLRIIDPEKEKSIVSEIVQNDIDAQFLPESGHILNGVINKIGVVLKDIKGYGIPFAEGVVTDQHNNLVTTFKVNKLGIGSFLLLASEKEQYTVKIKYLNKEHNFSIGQRVEKIGVSLSLANHKDKIIVALKTNPESISFVSGKNYSLSLHNGSDMQIFDILFENDLEYIKVFDPKTLSPGINILTLFNEDNIPILERIFFNFSKINIIESNHISLKKMKDSTRLKLNFRDIDPKEFNNISISILPRETQSYKRHYNLLSHTHLRPYLNGDIEASSYYFTNVTDRKMMDLDNLLITQGWSSYDWNTIFNYNNNLQFEFEQGIKLKANTNEDSSELESTYMVYDEVNNEPYFFEVKNTDVNHFYIDNLFPLESNSIYLSKFENKNVYPTKLYIQAIPSKIPSLSTSNNILRPKEYYRLESNLNSNQLSFDNIKNVQELDEVVLNAELTKDELRIKELKKKIRGDVDIIGDTEIKKHMYLSNYLVANGFYAEDLHQYGRLYVSNKKPGSNKPDPPPIVYFNGFRADSRDLYTLLLNDIDYIAIDRNSKGVRHLGVIRIISYQGSRKQDNRKKKQKFVFPLTFSPQKKFYVPKYRYYNDDFYIGFGTVDWKPQLSVDEEGYISFKIEQQEVPITLFVEGITNDGSFIFEEKTISLN